MTQQFIVDFALNSIKTTLLVSAPMLGFGLLTGLVISIFQAVTSIQELTLTFIPKILAVFLALFLFFPWIMQIMLSFTEQILLNFPSYIG
ncbi:MAG: flagellar biosynthesis protein FliQ [Nitrospinaceae bacterium]|nr:flagellar biosynthesis protein FliQ [Nitrospinaceae bacterium]NIR54995.1 flagellar biosynthesis protein FliQ [Nitrospinaceae bacterium]NIT82235.1 flagellar biosynthesis protein FliQ [Nitrospinaceae bacterium]NIX34620.1 flagellar biosynthesis protein FliQ [Nitrospinaceae bacterium]NIY15452.1 flagellar biosynthesis protein FliQ [Nitrospinaceae bacterium]